MTTEIHRPELEALIMKRMKMGGFHSVEDVLMQALESAPRPEDQTVGQSRARTARVPT
jgi:hypothetical protein